MWGRKTQNVTKPKHYSLDRLSDTHKASNYNLQLVSCMNELSNEFEAAETEQRQLNSVVKSHRRDSNFLNRNYTTLQTTDPSFLSRDKPHVT